MEISMDYFMRRNKRKFVLKLFWENKFSLKKVNILPLVISLSNLTPVNPRIYSSLEIRPLARITACTLILHFIFLKDPGLRWVKSPGIKERVNFFPQSSNAHQKHSRNFGRNCNEVLKLEKWINKPPFYEAAMCLFIEWIALYSTTA